MIYSKEYFLKQFKRVKTKLESKDFKDFYLRWYTDGLYTAQCENEKEFSEEPEPDEEKILFWEPTFQAKREDVNGIAHLEAHLEDDGYDPYWVIEIDYYKKPFKKRKGRTPIVCYRIVEVLEQHIKDIPKLIKQLKS